MKKLTLILMAAVLMVAVGSCKKDKVENDENENGNENTTITGDGIYNPAKRIAKYYYWDDVSEVNYINEIWHWDSKCLSSIDYINEDGTMSNSEYFTYENNRLSRIEYDGSYFEFSYDQGKLTKVERYSDNELDAEYSFSYGNNNKLDVISGFVKISSVKFNPLSMILSPKIVNRIEQGSEKIRAYGATEDGLTQRFSYRLTWDGDNVSEYVYELESTYGEYHVVVSEKVSSFYDAKNNPRYEFMDRYSSDLRYYCKNNVIHDVFTYHDVKYEKGVAINENSGSGEIMVTYQYDDSGYPVKGEGTCTVNGETYTCTYLYEYL